MLLRSDGREMVAHTSGFKFCLTCAVSIVFLLTGMAGRGALAALSHSNSQGQMFITSEKLTTLKFSPNHQPSGIRICKLNTDVPVDGDADNLSHRPLGRRPVHSYSYCTAEPADEEEWQLCKLIINSLEITSTGSVGSLRVQKGVGLKGERPESDTYGWRGDVRLQCLGEQTHQTKPTSERLESAAGTVPVSLGLYSLLATTIAALVLAVTL